MPSSIQIRMARAALKWGVRDLAAAAGVSPNTVTKIEADGEVNAATMTAVVLAMKEAGVEFIGEDGVRLVPKG